MHSDKSDIQEVNLETGYLSQIDHKNVGIIVKCEFVFIVIYENGTQKNFNVVFYEDEMGSGEDEEILKDIEAKPNWDLDGDGYFYSFTEEKMSGEFLSFRSLLLELKFLDTLFESEVWSEWDIDYQMKKECEVIDSYLPLINGATAMNILENGNVQVCFGNGFKLSVPIEELEFAKEEWEKENTTV